MTIRAGVVGLGIVSSRIIEQFTNHPDFEVVAVCDVNDMLLHSYTDAHPHVQGFTDYRQLVQNNEIDLVYVSTPPSFHADIVITALNAGKHVLCEKPLANSLEEAARMLDAAEKSGKVHALHFPLQYSDAVLEFERLYASGYIGDLRRVEVVMQFPQWPRPWQQNAWVGKRAEGGYTLEVGVHFIQSVQRIFGPISNITGTLTYPDDETACEISILATGTLAQVGAGNVQVLFNGFSQAGGKERVELNAYGSKGVISLQNWGDLFVGSLGGALVSVRPPTSSPSLMDHLANAIHGKEAVLCDFQVGYDAQKVLESFRALAVSRA